MIHTVTFERFDFSKTPAPREEITISIEYPPVGDHNIEDFEQKLWDKLLKNPAGAVKPGYSSWLERQ